MVKSKFPGKPSKLIQRTLVSAYSIIVPSYDTSAITEDVCHGLSVFDQIFGTDERKEDFYGFTQSEICASEERMEHFSMDVESKFCSQESTYPPILKEKQLHVAVVPLESCVSDAVHRKGKSETETAPLRRLKERNKCGKIWLLAKKNANRYLPKIPMRHNFKTLNKNSLIRFKHKPLASNYLTDKYCRKFTLPSRSLHSSRVIKPNKRFIDAEKNYESKWAVESVEPFESGMRVSSSKVIIREARLNITTEPAVAGPFSVKRNVPPDKDKLRSGSITCGICGALRHYKYILQTKKFGVFSCEPCRRFILRMIKQSKHFNGVCLECRAENGLGKCVIPIEAANKNESTDDLSAKMTRCEACWLSLCLQRYIIPSSLRKSLIKLIPDDLKVFLSSVLSVDLMTHLHLKSDTMNILVKDTNEKLSERFAANRFIKSVGSSLRTLERHDSSNPSAKSKVLRVKKNLSSQRLRPKNESVHESPGKDGGVDKSHYFPRGPRIKHVCRSASSVLRTSLVTLNDAETDDGVYNSSESDSGRRLRKNSRNSDTKMDRQCQMNKVRQCDDNAPAVAIEPQNDADFASQHYGARTLQDFGKDSSDESDENDDKLISTDFWEAYDPDEVFKTGFPLICSEPMNVRALCFLCGSAGVEKLLYCTSCCEPYHWYCAEGPSVFREDVELEKSRVNWICRKCKVCSTCGKGSDSRALTSCKRCRNSYHAECLNSKALNKRLFKSDRTWVCPSCLKCKSCDASSVFTHVGNIPLCSECFKLRQKGNYCPLCQGCYQDEDYNVQMMECGVCKCWIHAKCEGISHEKYQVLSFLPDTIEFVCRLCCSHPPAQWWLAVEDELKSGYLGILECLCKNKKMGDLLKESAPLEHACNCSTAEPRPADAAPTEGATEAETSSQTDDAEGAAVTGRPPAFALDRCVGGDKSPRVSEHRRRRLHCRGSYENDDDDDDDNDDDINETDSSATRLPKESAAAETAEPSCHCNAKKRSDISGRLLAIQANVRANQYASLAAFHHELEAVLSRVDELDWIVGVYREHLKQFFPWFDAASAEQPRGADADGGRSPIADDAGAPRDDDVHTVATAAADAADDYETLRTLTAAESFDYESVRLLDVRKCNLCKGMGEATPAEGGRLIYCGRNEWVHANCALWSSEVFEEIDGSLQNVHSAVSRGRQIRCSVCDKKGASVGCCFKNCTLTYHFVCAKRARCVFLQNKTIYCHGHQLRDATLTVVDEKDFEILRPVYVEMDRKKKRMECHTNVRLRIGALHVERLGKIDPHLSDDARYILPIHFRCTRLFWSTLKPWRIVQYHVQIKVSYAYHTAADDREANYTVDHSAAVAAADGEDAAAVVRLVLDELTSRACEATGSGAATPNADLLSPELQEAIYQDLPRDFLDDGTLHDMWDTYEDAGSPADRHGLEKETKRLVTEHELKKTKAGGAAPKSRSPAPLNGFKCLRDKNDFGDGRRPPARQSHADALDTLYGQLRAKGKRKMNFENSAAASSSAVVRKRQRHNGYISAAKLSDVVVDYYATYENLVQLDGMVDVYGVDEEPVKCSQCYRTYRTTLSFQRHLDTCNTDFGDYMISSCESDSASSEEEKCSGAAGFFEGVGGATAAVKVEPPTLHLPDVAASYAKYSTAFVVGETEVAPPPAAVGLQYAGNACADIQLNGNVYAYDNSGLQNAVTLQSILQNLKREQPPSVPAFAESSVKFEIVGDAGDAKLSSRPQEYTVQQFTLNEVAPPPTAPAFTLQNVAATTTTATPTYLIQQYPKPEVVPTFVTIDNGLAAAGDRLPQLQLQPMASLNFQPMLPTVAMVQQAPQVVQTPTTAYIVNAAAAAPSSTTTDLFAGQNNIIMAGGQPLLFGVETMVSNTVMSASHHQYLAAGNVGSSTLYSTTTTQFFQAAAAAKQLPQPSYTPGFIVLNGAGSAWQPIQQQQPQQQQIQQLQQPSPVKQAPRVEQPKQPPPVASIVSNNGDKYLYVRIDSAGATPTSGRAKSATPIIMKPVAAKPNTVASARKSIKVMKVKNNRPVAIQTVDSVIPLVSTGQPGEAKTAVRAVPANKTVSAAGSGPQNLQISIVDETATRTRTNQTTTSVQTTEATQPVQQCYRQQRSTEAAAAVARDRITITATNNQKATTLKRDTKEVAIIATAAAAAAATRHKDPSHMVMPKMAAAAVTVASRLPAKVGKAANARLTNMVIDLTDEDGSSPLPPPPPSSSSNASATSATAVAVSATSTAAASPEVCDAVTPVVSSPSQKTTVDSEEPPAIRTCGATTTTAAARSMPLIDFDPPAVDPPAKKVLPPPPVSETDRIFDELLRQHKLSLESESNSTADSATNASPPECSAAPNDEHLVETCRPPEDAVKDSGISGHSGDEVVAPSPPPAPTSKPDEPAPVVECRSATAALPGKSKYKPNVLVAAARSKPKDVDAATKSNSSKKKKSPEKEEKEKEKENVVTAGGQLLSPELEHAKSWKTASISYEVNAEDGFSYKTNDLLDLWNKILESVQQSRVKYKLPLLPKNVLVNSDSVYGLLGFENNASRYLLEQLPDAWKCIFYKPVFHKSQLYDGKASPSENKSGCARTEPFTSSHKYDMFGWLASRHRKPPKFMLISDSDIVNGNRRITSLNLPMAMRFRHLKETAKDTVGVFRSDIHGRGLFCLRDIDAGEMVIEYAGEVVRSTLTDKREKFYTSKGIGCYMFRIDDKYVVDATMCGNAARFINHSCDPNCYSRIVDILGKKHILIFALRRIPKGEELTYDYKFPLEDDKIHCHCLSRKCRKYLN